MVLVCHIVFCQVLNEIDVKGPNNVKEHITVGNVLEKLPKDQPSALEEDPSQKAKVV